MSTVQGALKGISVSTFIDQVKAKTFVQGNLDIESLVMAEQIRGYDSRLERMMQDMRLSSKLRERYATRMGEIRQMMAQHKAASENKPEKNVTVDALKLTGDQHKTERGAKLAAHSLLERLDAYVDTAAGEIVDPRRGSNEPIPNQVEESATKKYESVNGERVRVHNYEIRVNYNDLETEMKRLEDVAKNLDSERELQMIELNSIVNKRSNAVQWLSNITKKKHDTEAGVIANLR